MKSPFISRKVFDLVEAQSQVRMEMIELLRKQVADLEQRNAELKALFSKTSQFEIVEQEADTIKLKSKPPVPTGSPRSAWRGQRQVREAETRPVPNDSVAALEKRVQQAGGKT